MEFFNFIFKIQNIWKFYFHNKNKFHNTNIKKKNIILLESFYYYPSLIAFSYITNVLKNKFDADLYTYEPRLKSSYSRIRENFNLNKLIINTLFKSFGVKKKIFPKLLSKNSDESQKYFKKIYKSLKNKNDILKIKIKKVYVGDLIYDEYLRQYLKPTIDIKSFSFREHLKKSIDLFFYWNSFFEENNVKSIIVSHSVYLTGLPGRVGLHKNINVYNLGISYTFRLSKKNYLRLSGFENYKKDFQKLRNKKNLLKFSKKMLYEKLYGKSNIGYLTEYSLGGSPFKKMKIKKNLNKKKKVLVVSHCFTDAVHAYGDNLFVDFYSWMEFLGKLSLELDYEWLIKIHPNQFDLNYKYLNDFIKKYNKFSLLNKSITHNEIISKYNILSVLTVYGSVSHEYPLFNIPVINASKNVPHKSFNFNINPQTIDDLRKNILKIKKINKKKNKKNHKEIFEYYYMRFLSDYQVMKNHYLISAKLGTKYNSPLIFNEWFKIFNDKYHQKKLYDFKKFVDSNNFRMLSDNTKNESKYLDI